MSSVDYTCPTSEPVSVEIAPKTVAYIDKICRTKKERKPRAALKDGPRPVKVRAPKAKQADNKEPAVSDRETKVRAKRSKNRAVSDSVDPVSVTAVPIVSVQPDNGPTVAVKKERVTKASKEAVKKNRYAKNPLSSIPSINAAPMTDDCNVLDDTFKEGMVDFWGQLQALAQQGGLSAQSFVVFV